MLSGIKIAPLDESKYDFWLEYERVFQQDNEEFYVADGRISPTKYCCLCPKAAYLYATVEGISTQRRWESDYYLQYGKLSENNIARVMNNSNKWIPLIHNARLRENYELSLGAELDLFFLNEDRYVVCEVKTDNADYTLVSQPKHASQLGYYMANYQVDGILVRVSKKMERFEIHVPYNGDNFVKIVPHKSFKKTSYDVKKLMYDVIYNSAYSHYSIELGYLPRKPEYMKKTHCEYCMFKSECWENSQYTEMTKDQHLTVDNLAKEYVQWFNSVEQLYLRRRDLLDKINLYRKDKKLHRINHNDFFKIFK